MFLLKKNLLKICICCFVISTFLTIFAIKFLFLLSKDNEFNSLVREYLIFFKILIFIIFNFCCFFYFFKEKIKFFLVNVLNRISQISPYRWLLIVFFLAFCLRFLWIIFVPSLPTSDFLWYHKRAIGIMKNLEYSVPSGPTAYWPVGYPAFLAIIYFLFGANIFYAKVANVILSSLEVVIVYFLAREIFDDLIGKISSFLFAVYLENISYSSLLCSEILYLFFLLISIYLIVKFDNKNSVFVGGLFLGVSNLIRPVTLFLPFFIFFYYLRYQNFKVSFYKFLLLFFSMLIPILPWSIRNYIVFNKLVLVSTNGGCSLWMSLGPYATGTDFNVFNVGSSKDNPFLRKDLNEAERDTLARKLAISYAKSHLWFEVKLIPKKIFYLFKSGKSGVSDSFYKLKSKKKYHDFLFIFSAIISQVNYMIFIFLFILSILKSGKELVKQKSLILILFLIYYLMIFLIFKTQSRYHFPLMPFIIMIVSYFISRKVLMGGKSEIKFGCSLL